MATTKKDENVKKLDAKTTKTNSNKTTSTKKVAANKNSSSKPKTSNTKKTTTVKKSTNNKITTSSKKTPTKKSPTTNKKTTATKSTTKKATTSPKKVTGTIKNKTNETKKKVTSTTKVKTTTPKKKISTTKQKIEGRQVTPKKKLEKRMYIIILEQLKTAFESIKKFIENLDNPKQTKIKGRPLKTKEQILKEKKRIRIEIIGSVILVVGVLLILFNIPLGTSIYKSTASNKRITVPKFVKLKEECCSFTARFSSLRSVKSLKKDLEKIINSYEILECDNNKFYYNREENYTIVEYGVINNKIFNEVYISYGEGNSCSIDTRFKKLELLPNSFNLEDAKKDGNYVMANDKVYNKVAYDNFMNDVNNHKPSTLRVVSLTKEGDILITDLEYLKNNKFMVYHDATRDRFAKDHNSIVAYQFEHIKLDKNKLYAYNGDEFKIKDTKKYQTYHILTLPKSE